MGRKKNIIKQKLPLEWLWQKKIIKQNLCFYSHGTRKKLYFTNISKKTIPIWSGSENRMYLIKIIAEQKTTTKLKLLIKQLFVAVVVWTAIFMINTHTLFYFYWKLCIFEGVAMLVMSSCIKLKHQKSMILINKSLLINLDQIIALIRCILMCLFVGF